jgi:transcriptional regulator with XRE-family HTH domain
MADTGDKCMTDAQELGKRITNFRNRLELTPEQLAVNSGLDSGLIKAIEEGQAYPSLGVLLKLSRSLGQRLGTFMDDHFRDDPLIVRADERKAEVSPHSGAVAGPYRYFSLGRGKTDRHMEPLFIELDSAADESLSSHEGEEFIIVVSGEIILKYGKKSYNLKSGDSMYYNSIVPHFVGASSGKPASIYAVIFQPF